MFKPGDIVTDIDPESRYKGEQGEVVGVQLRFWEHPEVLVRFDRELYQGFRPLKDDECSDGIYDIYPPNELRLDQDWRPHVYARRIFGRSYHQVETLKDAFDPCQPCMIEDCSGRQEKVAWLNAWGTVRNLYVCAEHAAYYKTWSYMDVFPPRRQRKTA